MKAIVAELTDENMELSIGETIDVLGFAFQPIDGRGGSRLQAIWRDAEGWVWTIPTRAIRMLPNTESKDRDNLELLRRFTNIHPVSTNAIAGPTVGNRGVR